MCTQPARSLFLHHRWCRAGRGQGSSPGQSRYRPNTPHTPCRDCVHSERTRPGPPGTPCTAHTGPISCRRNSCRCRCRWHRWSPCTVSPSASGPNTGCRACTPLCGCSSLRRSHLQFRGQVEEDEAGKMRRKREKGQRAKEVRRWSEQEM